MRYLRPVLALLVVVALAAQTRAQEPAPEEPVKKGVKPPPPPPLRILKIRVGFNAYEKNSPPYYKPGFWTLVRTEMQAGEKDIVKDLIVTTTDNEDVPTNTSTHFVLEAKKKGTVLSYCMPGKKSSNASVSIADLDERKDFLAERGKVELTHQLYLTLGSRIQSLRDSLVAQSNLRERNNNNLGGIGGIDDPAELPNDFSDPDGDMRSTDPRFAAYETDAETLPGIWLGYHGVDLIILTTTNKEFLESLLNKNSPDRLRAIAQWVRNGGSLVVSVAPENQDLVSQLLQSPAWEPALPIKLPTDAGGAEDAAPERLEGVRNWAVVSDPFPDRVNGKVPIARLRDPKGPEPDWDVLARVDSRDDQRPVITQVGYGRGRVTFLAFAVDQAPFSKWKGRVKFLDKVTTTLAPRQATGNTDGKRWGDDYLGNENDLVSSLHRGLDNFDVKIVPFGWVALFIFLYILVVGPLDYLLLKYVFKRLEWTWITFPTVVFAVSFAAYFTAYAIKGKELRINQVDILDFDMRTELGTPDHKAKAYVYGQSFFTLLSPHIHNYTIGLEPNPTFWGETVKPALSADMVTFLPRAGMLGIGSNGRQAFMRRAYAYSGDVAVRDVIGLEGVLIPVWTTKAFTATWSRELPRMPFKADLTYFEGIDIKNTKFLSGTLLNNLDADLEDVWLIYSTQGSPNIYAYPLATEEPFLGKSRQVELKVNLQSDSKKEELAKWAETQDIGDRSGRKSSEKGTYNPTSTIKRILFYEKTDVNTQVHDEWLRPLDQSWRLKGESSKYDGIRTAVLYARVRFRSGETETLLEDARQPLPTHIWLGDLPLRGGAAPRIAGTMNQDTYIRVLLPVRPASGL